MEAVLLKVPQADCPVTHRFAPGVYAREIFMPAGTVVVGHEHKTEHFNIISKGRASVRIGDAIEEIIAPCTFVSKPGVRKALFIKEDMVWTTIHVTEETDLQKLEDLLIVKSHQWLEHHNPSLVNENQHDSTTEIPALS